MKLSEITKIPKVSGAGIATPDGFVIESQFTVGHDPEKTAAMAAQIMKRIRNSLNAASSTVIIYTTKSIFLLKETKDGIYYIVCQKDANLGLVKIKVDKIK